MTKPRTNPNPVFFPHHDNRPPGPSLSHSWATICPCCQTKISGRDRPHQQRSPVPRSRGLRRATRRAHGGAAMKRGAPLIERLLDRVVMIPIAGCWIFTGAVNESGYGISAWALRRWSLSKLHGFSATIFTPKRLAARRRASA